MRSQIEIDTIMDGRRKRKDKKNKMLLLKNNGKEGTTK